jgi:hypothetical protein
MKTHMTMLVLILVAAAGAAMADELPVPAQRIWAPAGDEIGTENHATLTGQLNDDHGDEDVASEELDVFGEFMGQGLFAVHKIGDDGRRVRGGGLFDNFNGAGLAGRIDSWAVNPGKYRAYLSYQLHDLRYDRDAELRNPSFPGITPPRLEVAPELEWRRGRAELGYHVSSALDLRLGANDMRREGSKSALGRRNPPDVQAMDSKAAQVWLGATTRLGELACDVDLEYATAENQSAYLTGRADDQESDRYSATLDATYDLSPRVRVLAAGRMSRIESTGSRTGTGTVGDTEGDTDSAAYQLALMGRLGSETTVRASARFDTHDTEASLMDADQVLYAADRERDRQQYQLMIGNRSLPRTDVKLRYRFTKGETDEIVAQDGRPGYPQATDNQSLDEESTRHDLNLRIRTRLARHVKLRARVRHTALEVDQDRTWETGDDSPWFAVLGDHERSRTSWDLAMQTRPLQKLPVDFGVRGFDQTFKRTGDEAAETTASMYGLFMNANWMASERITVFGMVTYGHETYELTGAEAVGTFEAFNVDANTLRLSPGAMVMITPDLHVEGWYEGVFFEDSGDESDTLDPIEADRDRLQVRARWQALDRLAVTAGYARNELDENRWDDYIQHLWSLSAHTSF